MKLKNALVLVSVLSLSAMAQEIPSVISTGGDGYFLRGNLFREMRNYVGSTHQLNHFNRYLTPFLNQDIEAEWTTVLNEFELGRPSSLAMLEEFI